MVFVFLYFIIYWRKIVKYRRKLFKGKILMNWVVRENWDEILLGGNVAESGRGCLEGRI